jgi:hypothetical protein
MRQFFRNRNISNQQAHADPPAAHAWRGYGRVDQEAQGEPTTDFETPGRMIQRGEYNGGRYGEARVAEGEALGEDSGPHQEIDGGSQARKAIATEEALATRTSALKRVATKNARKGANADHQAASRRRIMHLEENSIPLARAKMEEQKSVITGKQARFDGLSRHLKGYFDSWLVAAFVEIGVVAFDGWVLHSALKRSALDPTTILFTSLTVPLAVLVINHGLGILAGAMGRRVPPDSRLKIAAAVFAAGFLALMVAFVMLTAFRANAISGQNAALATWASGNLQAQPTLFVSPTWLGPLQIAGSIVAITVVAFYTMGKEGRELKEEITSAERALAGLEAGLARVEADKETEYRKLDEVIIAAHEIEVDAAAAQVEVKAYPEILKAKLDAEDGLAEAAKGRVRSTYIYVRQLYGNGGVVRMALATVTRWGRRYTPPPGDAEGEPYRTPAPGSNGHDPITPHDLQHLIED